jgi:putative flippase GtrA
MSPLLGTRMRALIFVCVGALCFSLQYMLLLLLARTGLAQPLADGVGFLTSAQLNFALSSRYTWGDRRSAGSPRRRIRWASFNLSVLLGLALNTGVFALTYRAIGTLPASALGVLTGAGCNYLLCDVLVFRRPARRKLPSHLAAPVPMSVPVTVRAPLEESR